MRVLIFILLLLTTDAFAAADLYSFNDKKKNEQFAMLTKEIRCIVCQNQNLFESDAPIANDLREKIYDMINNNQSDAEIKNYLVTRYGEFILLRPRLNKINLMLWLFPLLAFCVAFIFIINIVRIKRKATLI